MTHTPSPRSSPDAPARWATWTVRVALVLLAWAAFAPARENGFVDLDDRINFSENLDYRGLGWEQVRSAFTTTRLGVYQPAAWLLLGAEYLAFELEPRGYHLVSLLFHALNAVLLHAVAVALVARARPDFAARRGAWLALAAGLATALFVVHPLRAEVVAWASCQPYLPCASCALLATLAYLRAHPADGRLSLRWLAAAYGLAALAMAFKAAAVGLPLAFLALDACPLGRLGGWRSTLRALLEKVPAFALAAGFMALAFWARKSEQGVAGVDRDGLSVRVAQACASVWLYASKTVFPVGICVYYPRPEGGDFRSAGYVLGVIAFFAVGAAAIALRRRFPWLLAGCVGALALLAPHLGLLRSSTALAADRYSYLASMALVAPLAAGLCLLAERGRRRGLMAGFAAAGLAATCLLAVQSRDQARLWGTSSERWAWALQQAEWSSWNHLHLGTALGEEGRLDEAVAEFREALRIDPRNVQSLTNLGVALAGLGKFDEAVAQYDEALRLHPGHANVLLNLGQALAALGRLDEAIARFREALDREPALAEARAQLGSAYLRQGKVVEALAELEEALRLRPSHAEAHANLAAGLALQGKLAGAIEHDEEALRIDPGHINARVNLGIALAQSGRLPEAAAQLDEAVGTAPSNIEAHFARGAVLASLGRLDESVAECSAILRVRPHHEQARQLLDQVIAQQGSRTQVRR